ncbi:DUF4169 family protein [Nitratireductor sp. ZSWI3]|uniref:DUF4169 family protein n=1 Tax=Nitratireductor sp. ZSWI3 TaxID=2966359 RepID=UPI00214FAB05|nr:DUF4169 family protein [Nitratireductor sp. ZSWI3]MCR4267121.1 DUF4169 family protein [Nitratireductor sp. ZSWI3]
MGEIVNLRQERKRKARDEKELRAAENRALHGRTKAQKQHDIKRAVVSRQHLDGHRIGQDDETTSR